MNGLKELQAKNIERNIFANLQQVIKKLEYTMVQTIKGYISVSAAKKTAKRLFPEYQTNLNRLLKVQDYLRSNDIDPEKVGMLSDSLRAVNDFFGF